MAYAYKKGPTVYAGFRDERGRRVQRPTTARTIAEGRRLAHDLEARAERVRAGLEKGAPQPLSFSVFVSRYLADVARTKRSYSTIEGRLRLYLVPAFGERALQDIGTADIEELLAAKADVLGPQSREHLRRTLSVVFNTAIRWGLATVNPAAAVPKIKIPTEAIRFFEAEEIAPLLAAVPDRWRCAIAIALYLGARKGEVLGLRVADIDMPRRLVTLAHSYDGPTKSGKPRRVPIPDELAPLLAAQIPRGECGYLFSAEDRRWFGRSTAPVRVLRQAMIAAGIVEGYRHICRRKGCRYEERRVDALVRPCPKCGFKLWPSPVLPYRRFHDLRSTFGTLAYERTGDVRVVQATLGHSSPVLTEARYSSLRDRRLFDLADKMTFGVPPPADSPSAYPALTATPDGGASASGVAIKAALLKANPGVPKGIRTPVAGLKGQRPGPLDDGDLVRRRRPYDDRRATRKNQGPLNQQRRMRWREEAAAARPEGCSSWDSSSKRISGLEGLHELLARVGLA